MSQALYYPSPSLTLSAIGANGAAIPTTSILVSGSDGTNLRPLATDSSGHLIIDGTTTGGATAANQVLEIAQLTAINGKLPASLGSKLAAASLSIVLASDGALPLPSGAATAANQATEIASLASIDTKLTAPLTVTGPLTDAQLRATPVPVSGTVTVSGGATAANQATEIASLASIDGKTPALGQALAAASVPVVLTAAQLSTLTPLTSVTVTQSTGTNLHTTVDNFPAIQPVSGTVAATQSGTWNITNVSGTVSLPTGAATETTLAAINTKVPSLGQALAAASTPVVLTAIQLAALQASVTGRTSSNAPVRNDYTSVNVTTAAYVQLVASTTSTTNMVEVFDSSGQTLALAVGAVASEVIQFYITPGGNGQVPLAIPSGSRVSIKAISATASVGEIDVNFYS